MPVATIRTALYLGLLTAVLSGCGTGLISGESTFPTTTDDPEIFSILRHDPPQGRRWITCPGGRDEGRLRAIGASGGSIDLSNGHVLTVSGGAVADSTDFVFVEPRSRQVTVYASAPGRFSGAGVGLTLSWADRPGCNVPTDAVIARIRPGQRAEEIRSRPGARAMTIETDEPLLELSAFALAR